MPAIEIGRVCTKTRGRKTGRKCVVIDLMDKNFVLVTGPFSLTGIKRKGANAKHLEPTEFKIKIDQGCEDEEVLKAIKKSKLEDIFAVSQQR